MNHPDQKHRRVGSLLANHPQNKPAAPQQSESNTLAEAIKAQGASIDRLAQAVSKQAAAGIKVEMQPPPPRRYLITVERDSEKLPKSYLVEPLAK